MKLSFDEIVELIHREMYVRNGVMLGEKAAAKAILQAEEAAQQTFAPDVANAAPEEEALRILNDCIAKLQGVTRHAGNT